MFSRASQFGRKLLMSPPLALKSLVASQSVSVEHWLCVRSRLAFGPSSKTFSSTVRPSSEFPDDYHASIASSTCTSKKLGDDRIVLTHAANRIDELHEIDFSIKSMDHEINELDWKIHLAQNRGDFVPSGMTKKQQRDEINQMLDKQKQLSSKKRKEHSKHQELSMFHCQSQFEEIGREPFEFKKQQLAGGEHSMMVAHIPEKKNRFQFGIKGPLFLSETALLQIQSFIDVKNTNEALIIVGPQRSGLTTVLLEVLPRLVFSSTTGLSPVFVELTFQLWDNPNEAGGLIKHRFDQVAEAFGIRLSKSKKGKNENNYLKTIAGELASGLEKQGRCLWLLIDECQAPLVNTRTVNHSEIQEAAMMFKELIAAVSPHGRCACTGMSMVTFLNATRELSTDNFDMFNCSKYVLLGHKAPENWAEHFADSIIKQMQQHQDSVWSDVTAQDILNALKSRPEWLNNHPGLMTELKNSMSIGESKAIRIENSLREVKNRVKIASMFDFAVTLETLKSRTDCLRKLRLLASGNVADGDEAAALFKSDTNFSKFAAMLCGLSSWHGAIRPRMLTPYAHLCVSFICPESHRFALDLSTNRQTNKLLLSARFISAINLFTNCYSLFNEAESSMISDSVTQLLVRHGIGVADSNGNLQQVRSMFDLPMLQKLYQTMCQTASIDSDYDMPNDMDVYRAELAAYQLWKESGCINSPPKCGELPIGMLILKSLGSPHFSHEFSLILHALVVQGFQLYTLESLAFTFETCALKCKRLDFFKDQKDGTLCLRTSQRSESKREI